jgi:archaellum component FlaC
MAKLELCGISLKLQALDDAQKAIEDALAELTSGAGGIADAIGDLQNQLGSALDDALADLENLIPEIKAEFPNLQKEINELLNLMADPFKALEIQKQIDKIRELFGDIPTFDVDKILSEITGGLSDIEGGLTNFVGDITKALGDLAGTLSSFDPCKLVPNIDGEPQYDEFGDIIGYEYVTKGTAPEAPVVDAVKLPAPPAPKPVEEVTPAVDNSNVRAPITPELKEATETNTPPATAVQPPTPPETIRVILRPEFGLCRLPKSSKPMVEIFIKTEAPDGSGFFWKPKGYSTQLEFEAWLYMTVRGWAVNSKTNIQKIIELNEAGTHNIPQELLDSQLQRLKDCVAFLKADGESNLTQATKISENVYSVSVEQAKLSWCPKPEGEWLGNFGIKAD